jgi:hypothetical protein
MREDSIFLPMANGLLLQNPTQEQDMPETPPPMIKTSNINYSLLFIFFYFFRSLKIKRIKTAQKDAEIPIKQQHCHLERVLEIK